ncbi:MAG: hypothetical protein ACOZIN_18795 [Myxococcota bacterium]
MRAHVLLILAALTACGAPPELSDGGMGAMDGGTDAGISSPVVLTPLVPSQPRRGPVLLRFQVEDPDGQLGALTLRPTVTGAEYERVGSQLWVVLPSFSLSTSDGPIALELVGQTPTGEVTAPFTLDLRNAPDVDRVVMTAHRLEPLDGGGASSEGIGVSAFTWGASGTVVGAPVRLTVPPGPSLLRAAPHGRATAVMSTSQVTLLRTPLSGRVADVSVGETLSLPHGSPAALEWGADGRYLYVAGGAGPSGEPPTLWRFEPAEDLSTVGAPSPLVTLPGPPSKLAVDGRRGRLLIYCGSGGSGLPKLLLYDRTGAERARLEADLGLPEGLAVDPEGEHALLTSNLFGNEVRRFRLGDGSLTQEGTVLTTLDTPFEVVFHPAPSSALGGPLALVSTLNRNTVAPVFLGANGSLSLGTAVSNVPLAAELDVIARGAQTGTVFVSAVSQLVRLTVSAQGVGQHHGAAVDFGTGTRNVTQGVAVQR